MVSMNFSAPAPLGSRVSNGNSGTISALMAAASTGRAWRMVSLFIRPFCQNFTINKNRG